MDRSCLIGHTGFVGGNLAVQRPFSDHFNSRTIEGIRGQGYDLIICAGVTAVKWWANQHADEDWAGIEKLLRALEHVMADRFILVSTVDVYPRPMDVDENTKVTGSRNQAYGRHRLAVETFVRNRFPVHHVVRLPALFGPGLKKNAIYDLLHDNQLDVVNPESRFQYYDVRYLTEDLIKVVEHEIPLINLVTEPLTTKRIVEECFPDRSVGARAAASGSYDVRSRHASLWAGQDGYLYAAEAVLTDLRDFVRRSRQPT